MLGQGQTAEAAQWRIRRRIHVEGWWRVSEVAIDQEGMLGGQKWVSRWGGVGRRQRLRERIRLGGLQLNFPFSGGLSCKSGDARTFVRTSRIVIL
jgi:hypothetical protein